MSNLAFLIALIRVTATAVGYVVIIMWLLGCLGVADFRLLFIVPEVLP